MTQVGIGPDIRRLISAAESVADEDEAQLVALDSRRLAGEAPFEETPEPSGLRTARIALPAKHQR